MVQCPPRRVLARSGNRGVNVLRNTRETSITHNARHRQRRQLPTLYNECARTISAVPAKSASLRGVLKDAAVRKTVASANVKSRSAKC